MSSLKRHRILILYRELAGYILKCIEHLAEHHEVEIELVAYPVNPEAPFQFEFSHRLKVHNRFELTEDDWSRMKRTPYDLILCGGWIDQKYLEIVKANGARSTVAFDKPFTGSLKDRIAAFVHRIEVKPLFESAFVAGPDQIAYARKMGFVPALIFDGVYSCDTSLFNDIAEQRTSAEPHRIWYVGRYLPQKGFNDLFESFAELVDEGLTGWEIYAAGTGDAWEQRKQHSNIHHLGFVQPQDIRSFMKEGDVFVLPSLYEPWGVVVHEFVCAGYPLLLSDKVGARKTFLHEGENGFSFQAGNRKDLKEKLRLLCSSNNEQLQNMSKASVHLSRQFSPDYWSNQVMRMIRQ